MNWLAKAVLVLLSIATTMAKAQFSMATPSLAQETPALGYWVDPSTGLMWAWIDNGKDDTVDKSATFNINYIFS